MHASSMSLGSGVNLDGPAHWPPSAGRTGALEGERGLNAPFIYCEGQPMGKQLLQAKGRGRAPRQPTSWTEVASETISV